MTTGYQDMSDDELDAATNPDGDAPGQLATGEEDDDDQDDDEEEGDDDQDEDDESDDDAEGQADAGQPEGQKPDGPGDKTEALRQERERSRQLAEENRRFRETEARRRAQAEDEEVQAEYLRLLEHDADAAGRYLDRVGKAREERVGQQAQAQAAVDRMDLSETYARDALGNDVVDATIASFQELMADPDIGPTLNFEAIAASRNPFGAVKKLVERLGGNETPKKPDTKAADAEVSKRVAAIAAKQGKPTPGHKSIGRFGSSTSIASPPKAARDMTDAELEAASRKGRRGA